MLSIPQFNHQRRPSLVLPRPPGLKSINLNQRPFHSYTPELGAVKKHKRGRDPIIDEFIPIHFSHLPVTVPFPSFPPEKIAQTFPQVTSSRFQAVLESKLEIATPLCNFYKSDEDIEGKRIKQSVLEDIFAALATRGGFAHISPSSFKKVLAMIYVNINRKLPDLRSLYFSYDDLMSVPDPAWPHLQIVYNLLNRMIEQVPDEPSISVDVTLSILPMLRSPDENERKQLVNFVITYLTFRRQDSEIILSKLSHLLTDHMENGFIVPPTLEIMSHIFQTTPHFIVIDGAKYTRQIVGLLREKNLPFFYYQLHNLITFLTEEYNGIVTYVVQTIFKSWPYTRNTKQSLYLKLLNSLIHNMLPKDRCAYMPRVISLYAESSRSMSHKVAESALDIWSSFRMEPIIQEYSRKIIPTLFPIIMRVRNEHWSRTVCESAETAIKMMQRIDPKAVQDILKQKDGDETTNAAESMRVSNWAMIARYAFYAGNDFNLSDKLGEIKVLYNKPQKTMQLLTPIKSVHRSRSLSYRAPVIIRPLEKPVCVN